MVIVDSRPLGLFYFTEKYALNRVGSPQNSTNSAKDKSARGYGKRVLLRKVSIE